ncbi:kinase-like protein [Laetiporus sulphureus 93-53]|uniref:Kinase-like protein n=1 Tax=Laetiporus sulphureus 93-53 TaxID=1314785 RepID=A0A165F2X4_9APHY|nr:kinase-like protein [Laetiporus sulphureus 93-53]KZT08263.1 kinase-like protein [Laetiporus sulphureus 93-53]
MQQPVIISVESIPRDDTIFFKDSTFFTHHTLADLPSKEQIIAAALPGYSNAVSLFPSLSLAVKRIRGMAYGECLAEPQSLWALRRFVPEVRVPEVYGWRREEHATYLFMELIDGVTLLERWPSLQEHEKTAICTELGMMVRALQRTKRPSGDKFIGTISGQVSADRMIHGRKEKAFPDARTFYEFFMQVLEKDREKAYQIGMPRLDDDAPVVFTHGDLYFSNIMVSRTEARVMAIIDWEQAGWMPQFWEHAKVRLLMMWQDNAVADDMLKYFPSVVDEINEDVFKAFVYYVDAWGNY